MLTAIAPHSPEAFARAAFSWWDSAGVDVLVDDQPHAWLAAPAPVLTPSARPVPVAKVEAPARPTSLDGVLARLMSDTSLVDAGPQDQRIAASGDPAAPLMIMTDLPDDGDAARGGLLLGDSARLLDAMLAALGLSRADCYFASLCPGRPASGLLPSGHVPLYADLARAHIGFAGAPTVWLLGSAAIRAILGVDALPLPQGLQLFNHEGAKKAVVAGLAPRFLVQQPAYKAQMWAAMQPLRKGIKA